MRTRNGLTGIRILAAIGAVLIGTTVIGETTFADEDPHRPSSMEQRYIVILEDGAVGRPGVVAERHAQRYGAEVERVMNRSVDGYAAEMTSAEAGVVAEQPGVAAVGLDPVGAPAGVPGPLDKSERIYGSRHGCATPLGEEVNPMLDLDCLDDVRADVDVAVLDTSIDPGNADLDVFRSVNCFDYDPQVGCELGPGNVGNACLQAHGRIVADSIARFDNEGGEVGVAAGARIWSVAVAEKDVSLEPSCGSPHPFFMSDVIAGVEWVTANAEDIEVANMSMQFPLPSDPAGEALDEALEDAIDASIDAGVVYVVAAGNKAGPAAETIPAKYDRVITASAIFDSDGESGGTGGSFEGCRWPLGSNPPVDHDDTSSDRSNYGPAAAVNDLAAPGVDIAAPGTCTSTAAALTSGAAAVLASRYDPEASKDEGRVAEIRTALLTAADPNDRDHGGYDDQHLDNDPQTPATDDREPLLDVHDEGIFDPRLVSTYEPIPGAEPIVEVRDADTGQPCGEVVVFDSEVFGGCVVNDLFSQWYGASVQGYTIFSCGGGSIPIWLNQLHVGSDGTFAADASDIDTSCAGSFIAGTPCHTEPSSVEKDMLHAQPWNGRFFNTSNGAPRAYLGLCIELGSSYQDWIDGITASVTSEAPLTWSFLTSHSRDILGPSNGFQTAAWTACCSEDPELEIVWEDE